MPASKDTINTQSVLGRNLTPLTIIRSVREVLGSIDLDPCSDAIANADIKAREYYTWKQDGASRHWEAKAVWINPPGSSFIGGTEDERIFWASEVAKDKGDRQPKPKSISHISQSYWHKKAYSHFAAGDVDHILGLVYRGGSLGSMPYELMMSASICLTCSGAESEVINGSGRINFDLVLNGDRVSTKSNTQSSAFYLLSEDRSKHVEFHEEFSQYGIVRHPFSFGLSESG